MSRQKISDTKIEAMFKMKELGFSMTKIAVILGVSRLTINDHLNPESYKIRLKRVRASRRQTVLDNTSLTTLPSILKYLQRRPHAVTCGLCGAYNERLYYHYWDKDHIDIGVWVCSSCRIIAENADRIGDVKASRVLSAYHLLKAKWRKELLADDSAK